MSDTVLIPSAVLVPDELKLELGPIPTGMIPVHGKPAFEHIADSYEDAGACTDLDFVIACWHRREKIEQWAERSARDWELIEVGETASLGEAVNGALDTLQDGPLFGDGDLFVHFADTLVYPPCVEQNTDQITYETVNHPIRWTTFDQTANGRIESISEKFSPAVQGQTNTFVGQFQLSAPEAYRTVLDRAVDATSRDRGPDPFYTALLEYLSERAYTLRRPDQWIDVGHLDTYYRAKTEFLNTREFNEMQVDERQNVIRKESDDPNILVPEIRWYNQLPKDLQPFIPQIFDYSTDGDVFVELEYVGYPTLGDIHLYGDHGIHIWKGVFSALFSTLEMFREHSGPDGDALADAQRTIYLDKTANRLADLRGGSFDAFFEADAVTVNGTEYDSVGQILDRLADDLADLGLLDPVEPTVIHGDLCFANILYDVRTSLIKLIDPRGAFGSYDIYGDYRYDLAKLLHSVDGNYEFIINDRFDVDVDGTSIDYTIYTSDEHERRWELFLSMLESRFPGEIQQLWAIESLLWLSMVPLHADEPTRQYTMLAQGIEKYNRVFEDR